MIFNKLFKNDSEEIMDVLSEKYKYYENQFWDLNHFYVMINSLDDAIIYYCKKNEKWHERFLVERNKFEKIMQIPLSWKIDLKLYLLRKKFKRENIKQLIKLKEKYYKMETILISNKFTV